jgi:dienelactone hydrolase
MISIFTPITSSDCDASLAPYVDSSTAAFLDQKFSTFGIPPGLFGSLQLQVCSPKPKAKSRHSPKLAKQNLLVFSPALGTTRIFYSTLAQQLASTGYIVVTVDHPYDVDIVSFPDNSTILGVDIPDASLPLALNTRVKDISFVVNQIRRPSFAKDHFAGLKLACDGGLEVSQIGVFGHSFGGAAAAEAMLYDSRLEVGANLDGTFFGKVLEQGLKKPFLIFAHEGKNRTNDPSWEAIWPKLKGWKRELMLDKSAHYTFSDLPMIAKTFGFADQVASFLGTIDGGRAGEIVSVYVGSFFGLFMDKKKTALFDGKSSKFPEVSFASQ